MILCVDVGNSFVKYGVASSDGWIALGRQRTGRAATQWPADIVKARRMLHEVTGVMVASVVPAVDRPLARRLTSLTTRRAVFVNYRMAFPFVLRVPRPVDVGVDRLCAAAGACRHGARTAIVVDVGSAITVDVVDDGAYVGGLILAGPSLMLHALADRTAKLPRLDFERASRERRKGTAKSMIDGARVGAVGAIREAVRHLRARAGGRPRTFVTGGAAAPLVADLPAGWRHEPDLVGYGLHRIWQLNSRARHPA